MSARLAQLPLVNMVVRLDLDKYGTLGLDMRFFMGWIVGWVFLKTAPLFQLDNDSLEE